MGGILRQRLQQGGLARANGPQQHVAPIPAYRETRVIDWQRLLKGQLASVVQQLALHALPDPRLSIILEL
jgi:hypothetical protein